jgi:hypothetical protein
MNIAPSKRFPSKHVLGHMTTILNSKEVEFALLDWKVATNAG